jgi:hypothetical protein
MQEITYREAIVAALQEEMRRDPKTLVMGEDVGPSGGPFKTCQGLIEEFGHARVRDTPIAEVHVLAPDPLLRATVEDINDLLARPLRPDRQRHRHIVSSAGNSPCR